MIKSDRSYALSARASNNRHKEHPLAPLLNARIITPLIASAKGVAQAQTASERAYVIDARNEVAKSGFGLCWRTGHWTPAAAAAAPKTCDFTATLKDDQTFAFGKAALKPAALAQIDKEVVAELAKSCLRKKPAAAGFFTT